MSEEDPDLSEWEQERRLFIEAGLIDPDASSDEESDEVNDETNDEELLRRNIGKNS